MATESGLHGPSMEVADSDLELNSLKLLDAANFVTLLGLVSAVSCAILAVNGHMAYAVVALMAAGVCDLFDGVIARRCERGPMQRKFGEQLDSIVDACSFGFAPVVLAYSAGLNGLLELPFLALFIVCAVWRLASFNVIGLQSVGSRHYFTGLPVTYVSMFLPLAFLAGFWGEEWLRGSVLVTMFVLAIAMVSKVPIRKPRGVFYLLFPIAGVSLASVFIVFAEHLAL